MRLQRPQRQCLWWCTSCAGVGVDKAANESQAADWSCRQYSSSTSAHGPSTSRAAVPFQRYKSQPLCAWAVVQAPCTQLFRRAAQGSLVFGQNVAVTAAVTLRRHTLRLLLRQQRRCGVTFAHCCCGSRDVAASHSQIVVGRRAWTRSSGFLAAEAVAVISDC